MDGNEVVEGKSVRKAAYLCGIPHTTLQERNANGNMGFHDSGRTTSLSRQT